MRSLFESLAWQALGLAPEITPVPNRSNKSNIAADDFDFFSSAGDRSWHELSENHKTRPTEHLNPEKELQDTAVSSPLDQALSDLPSALPVDDAPAEEPVEAIQDASEAEAKQNSAALPVADTGLQYPSIPAPPQTRDVHSAMPHVSFTPENFAREEISANDIPPHPFVSHKVNASLTAIQDMNALETSRSLEVVPYNASAPEGARPLSSDNVSIPAPADSLSTTQPAARNMNDAVEPDSAVAAMLQACIPATPEADCIEVAPALDTAVATHSFDSHQPHHREWDFPFAPQTSTAFAAQPATTTDKPITLHTAAQSFTAPSDSIVSQKGFQPALETAAISDIHTSFIRTQPVAPNPAMTSGQRHDSDIDHAIEEQIVSAGESNAAITVPQLSALPSLESSSQRTANISSSSAAAQSLPALRSAGFEDSSEAKTSPRNLTDFQVADCELSVRPERTSPIQPLASITSSECVSAIHAQSIPEVPVSASTALHNQTSAVTSHIAATQPDRTSTRNISSHPQPAAETINVPQAQALSIPVAGNAHEVHSTGEDAGTRGTRHLEQWVTTSSSNADSHTYSSLVASDPASILQRVAIPHESQPNLRQPEHAPGSLQHSMMPLSSASYVGSPEEMRGLVAIGHAALRPSIASDPIPGTPEIQLAPRGDSSFPVTQNLRRVENTGVAGIAGEHSQRDSFSKALPQIEAAFIAQETPLHTNLSRIADTPSIAHLSAMEQSSSDAPMYQTPVSFERNSLIAAARAPDSPASAIASTNDFSGTKSSAHSLVGAGGTTHDMTNVAHMPQNFRADDSLPGSQGNTPKASADNQPVLPTPAIKHDAATWNFPVDQISRHIPIAADAAQAESSRTQSAATPHGETAMQDIPHTRLEQDQPASLNTQQSHVNSTASIAESHIRKTNSASQSEDAQDHRNSQHTASASSAPDTSHATSSLQHTATAQPSWSGSQLPTAAAMDSLIAHRLDDLHANTFDSLPHHSPSTLPGVYLSGEEAQTAASVPLLPPEPSRKTAAVAANTSSTQSRIAAPVPSQFENSLYLSRTAARRSAASSEPSPLRIDIGRIDVERADTTHAHSTRARRTRPGAKFTLDEYLKQRSRSR